MSEGVCSYLRVSTDKQREDETIANQRDAILKYCEDNDIPIADVHEFADDGVSSRVVFAERPGSRGLLREAKRNRVRLLLFTRQARLGRDAADTIEVINFFHAIGTQLITVNEGGPLQNNANGNLHSGMNSVIAQWYREQLAEETAAASRRLAQCKPGAQAMAMGGIMPYGYRQQGEDREARYVLATDKIPGCDVSEVDVVIIIFEKAAAGETVSAIAKYLNRLQIPPVYARDARMVLGKKTVGLWRPGRIVSILRNETYKGTHCWGKRKTVWDPERKINPRTGKPKTSLIPVPREQWTERPVPPIVDSKLWARAQVLLDRNQTERMAHAKHAYLLSRLIFCKECGRPYIGIPAKQANGTEIFYYRCGHKYGFDETDRCSSSPTVRARELENSIWDYVRGYLLRPELAVQELAAKKAVAGDLSRQTQAEIKKLEGKRARIPEDRKHAISLCTDGLITRDDLKQQLARKDAEDVAIGKRLSELDSISAETEIEELRYDWAGRLIGDRREQLLADKLTFTEKRKFTEALVEGVTIKAIPGQKEPEIRAKFRFSSDFERAQKWSRATSLAHDYTGTRADIN